MAVKPQRVQLKRTKGWLLPPNTVVVARPSLWGNPFTVTTKMKPGTPVAGVSGYIAVPTVEDAVECYRLMLTEGETEEGTRKALILKNLHVLRGKNLACWCKLDQPCHADVLLDLANRPMVPRAAVAAAVMATIGPVNPLAAAVVLAFGRKA